MKDLEKSMPVTRVENPFPADYSGFGYNSKKGFVSVYPPGTNLYGFHLEAHNYFRDLILSPQFACVAAQSATKTENYAFCAYPDISDVNTAEGIAHDIVTYRHLFEVDHAMEKPGASFVSFVAAFQKPIISNQLEGAEYFYNLLKNLHEADNKFYDWDKSVSNDISDPKFSFSLAGNSFFMPFLYEFSGSKSRRSAIPMVVFNAHVIFEKLRSMKFVDKASGKESNAYKKLEKVIRDRQPWGVHPNLGEHGDVNEFVQYVLVDPDPETMEKDSQSVKKVLGDKPFLKDNGNK